MKKNKRIIWFLLFVIVIFLIIKGWWNSQLGPFSNDESIQAFVVQKGEGLSSVGEKLKKQNLIKSSQIFTLYAEKSGFADKIQSGTFKLSPSMAAKEILETLTGNPTDNWVTLLEGWRVEEMADKLSEQGTVDSEQFINQAKKYEGYLFPDTYLIPKDYSIEQIIQLLRDNFEKKYNPEIRSKIKALGLSEDEGVILASIIEREARSQKVRTMVASILLKRFKIEMGLNADATLQYALGYQPDEKSWWKRHLTVDDKKVKSPYNTYLYRGLPPAPIANPSLSSLKAVVDADPSTPYLYYYHDSKGNSHYAKTLEEHTANVLNNP